ASIAGVMSLLETRLRLLLTAAKKGRAGFDRTTPWEAERGACYRDVKVRSRSSEPCRCGIATWWTLPCSAAVRGDGRSSRLHAAGRVRQAEGADWRELPRRGGTAPLLPRGRMPAMGPLGGQFRGRMPAM